MSFKNASLRELVAAELAASPVLCASLNVSPDSIIDPDWWSALGAQLRGNPGVAQRITLEITETAAIQNIDETAGFVTRAKDLGCRIAIDDFGAGYTSFRNLKALSVDILKLDGSFCANLAENLENQYFVRSLIDMARQFQIKTVAEWVETPEDAEFLRQLGADYLQGNLFGKASLDIPWPGDGDGEAPPAETKPETASRPAIAEKSETPAVREEPNARVEPPRPTFEENDEPDMSRLRLAIDALNAQFRRGRD